MKLIGKTKEESWLRRKQFIEITTGMNSRPSANYVVCSSQLQQKIIHNEKEINLKINLSSYLCRLVNVNSQDQSKQQRTRGKNVVKYVCS